MNKKDIIMITVLLNAGLLVTLFTTTLKSEKKESSVPVVIEEAISFSQNKEERPLSSSPASTKPLESSSKIASTTVDEVEEAIRKYAAPVTASSSVEITPNFAQDLQAMAPAEVQLPSLPEQAVSHLEIRVKKGDVLEKIAKMHHTTVEQIMKTNHLSSTRLKIGQVLKIPQENLKNTPSLSPAEKKEDEYYTIRQGDNPWTIAVKHHMRVEELLKLNDLNEEKARRLKPGDKIRIK